MSGIYILNMEMPISCDGCKWRMVVGCCGNLPHNTRMPNCPLIPATYVVPVVRCGECKHWKRIRNGCILASCELDALVRSEDFFCADGERKDGDGE